MVNASKPMITQNAHLMPCRSSAGSPGPEFRLLGSAFVCPSKIGQLAPRIRKPAFRGDGAQVARQLAVMFPGVMPPPLALGCDFLQCQRVLVRHPARYAAGWFMVAKI
jgi:hypothetical protein